MNKKRLLLGRASAFLLAAAALYGQAIIPVPQISGISPTAVTAGSGGQTLTIYGANFSTSTSTFTSAVTVNGNFVYPTSSTPNTITVSIPAAGVAAPGTASVVVSNLPLTLALATAKAKPLTSLGAASASNPAYLDVASPISAFKQNVGNPAPTTLALNFVSGDFNGDGIIDVAVGNSDGTVQVYLSDGQGNVNAAAAGFTTSGPVSAMAAGDFNGDGILDLVVASQASTGSTLALFLGNGDGTFTASSSATGSVSVPVTVAALGVADFGGDGSLDVAVVGSGSPGSFIPVNGDGQGGLSVGVSVAVGNGASAVAIADFNGDGYPDAVVTNTADNTVTVLLYTPPVASTVATNVVVVTPTSPFLATTVAVGNAPTGVVVGDFNNDGFVDFVTANHGDGTYTFEAGNGNGTFGPQVALATASAKTKATAKAAKAKALSASTPAFPTTLGTAASIVVADFNADGIADIAMYDGTDIAIFLGDGTGNFNYLQETPTVDSNGYNFLAAGDLNGDGYPDLFAGLYSSVAPVLTVPAATTFSVPATVVFGNVSVGSSTNQNLILNNGSTANVNVQTVALSGANAADFSVTNTCPTVNAGASCTLTIGFKPSTVGSESATLTITDDAGTQTVSLVGNGTGAPVASVPATVSVSANLGASASTSVTVSNTGTGPLAISNVTVSGPFAITNNACGTSLAAGASCSISLSFTPTAIGSATGTLTLTDNSGGAAGSQQNVSLSGTGNGALASVSPTSLSFGSVNDGATSAAQTVTVTNNGNQPLTVSAVSAAAPFAASGCTTAVAANGGTCKITVTFAPTTPGAATGSLTITDNNAVGSTTQTVTLTGTGVAVSSGPKATVTPSSLTFSSEVGVTSAAQTVTLKNTGTSSLSISSIAATGEFSIASRSCGTTLAVNASCTVSVQFRPTTTAAATGTLTFTDNSVLGKTQVVTLSGTVLIPTAVASPTTLTFASQNENTTSAAQVVTLTNTGTGPLTINSINLTGNYVSTASTCRTTLAAGASCTVSVAFSPRSAGTLTGTLTFADNSSTGTTQVVKLSGTAVNRKLTANPGSLSFTGRPSVKSAAQTVTITNSGSVVSNLSGVTLSGTNAADFAISSNTCGSTLAVGASCKVSLTFDSAKAGVFSAQLNVASDAPSVAVSLLGFTL